jgi:hypothetical protein
MVAENKFKFSPGDKVILAYPECEAHKAIENFIGYVEEAYETECTIYKENAEEGFWVKNSEIELIQKASVVKILKEQEEKPTSALDKQVSGNHYKDCGIQPIEYIHANGLSYLEGNVIKYTTRHSKKNGKADIEKAIHYLELILEMEYKGETE